MAEWAVGRGVRPGRVFAWQGWRVDLPPRWDPVKLDGDAAAGHALIADAVHPRLGLQWRTPRKAKRFDPAAVVRQTLVAEVGQLAADEAKPWVPATGEWASPLLYVEPDPPGRDVWVGYSPASGRVLTVVAHVRRHHPVLTKRILPTLVDQPGDRAAVWAVFDLSLVVPGGFRLTGRRLNAGDLALTFADRRGAVVGVRQVAVAELAVRRRPLDGWLADQQRADRKRYRPAGPTVDVTVTVGGRPLAGRLARVRRRRRFALATWHPPERVAVAVHDVDRDRLVLLAGTDEGLLREVAGTVGVGGRPPAVQSRSP